MRFAVLSDIHANLEALDAVCRAGDEQRVQAWICLGDIVGYGADPRACLHRVRLLTDQVVLGNHDAAAAGLTDLAYFNEYARAAARWTADQLTPDERQYLTDLPLTREDGEAFYVHAEPCQPQAWGYVMSGGDALEVLAAIDRCLCFIGHSHQPFICAERQGELQVLDPGARTVEIQESVGYLVNVGSVGQPRDGDPRACFAVWDDERRTLEFARPAYDIAAAQSKIIARGLPPFLAKRLAFGY